MFQKERDKLVGRVTQLLRTVYAITLLTSVATRDLKRKLDRAINLISGRSKIRLRQEIDLQEARLRSLRKSYGVAASNSELLRYLDDFEARSLALGDPLAPKQMLMQVFTNLEGAIPEYSRFPAHTKFFINDRRDKPLVLNWFILEVAIFGELCGLYNMENRLFAGKTYESMTKQEWKTACALRRSICAYAYFFVEAYINGLAFCVYVRNQDSLSPAAIDALTEWDRARNKPKQLTLREKLMQYTKLACGGQHQPIHEDNCPEMKTILEQCKPIRDSLAHAAPRPDMELGFCSKEAIFISISSDGMHCIVRAAIDLVKRIRDLTPEYSTDLPWLEGPGEDGLFPESVFN